jgi:hypothetical protein
MDLDDIVDESLLHEACYVFASEIVDEMLSNSIIITDMKEELEEAVFSAIRTYLEGLD